MKKALIVVLLILVTFNVNTSVLEASTHKDIEIVKLTSESDIFAMAGTNLEKDYQKRMQGSGFGWRMNTGEIEKSDIRLNFQEPKNISGVSAVGMWIYLDDPSKFDSIQLQINHDNVSYKWIRTDRNLSHPLEKGWNYMRWPAHEGHIGDWANSYGIRIYIATNTPADWTLGGVYLERPSKAQLLFVQDGGYESFLTKGYPELKQRSIHTTWALTPGRLGQGEVISESDVDLLAQDHLSAFSFHSWASEVHSTMTSEEVADNMIKSMRWLNRRGLQPQYWFRAAITQNDAPNHTIMQDYIEAYASPYASASLNIFPFKDPYNVPRINLHGSTKDQIDRYFSTLKKTRALMVVYTHGIGTGMRADMTEENWDYFLTKVDEAIEEGWLESVTYDILRTRYEKQFGSFSYNHLFNLQP